MRNCIPEETLQAWFDGELAENEAASVAAHLIECLNCAECARTVEGENLIVSKVLAVEFDPTIPTERLRERVATAVAGFQHASLSPARSPLSQRALGFPVAEVSRYRASRTGRAARARVERAVAAVPAERR